VIALVGRLDVSAAQLRSVGIGSARALLDLEPDQDTAVRHAAELLARLAEDAGRTFASARTEPAASTG
jgi:hypothetical protein